VLDLGYRHVDVFSRRALQGNGLVVVLDAENLSTAVMQQLTREVRQFETAFLTGVDLPGRSARVRIFTEDEEQEAGCGSAARSRRSRQDASMPT
jgi:PhzF family phenazine biosynthesis protein